LIHNVDYRRRKLREILREREDANIEHNAIYDRLETTELKIVEIIKESSQHKYNKIEIEVEIEKGKCSIEKNEKLVNTISVNTKENNSFEKINNILQGRKKVC